MPGDQNSSTIRDESTMNIQDIMRQLIRNKIGKCKSNLEEVKSYVEEQNQKPVGDTDKAYIEGDYVEYCMECWINDTRTFLRECKNRSVMQDIFNSLDHIDFLIDIPDPLNKSEYYTLLMRHYELVSAKESAFVSQFKKECWEQFIVYSDTVKKELVFLEAFIDILSSARHFRSIISKLKIEDFCSDISSFNELINNIIKLENNDGEKGMTLQLATNDIDEQACLILQDKLKEIIARYLKPVRIEEKTIDNRCVVEVIGDNVVVSEMLLQLEHKFSLNTNIEEVRFICPDVIHVDANFTNDVWHGKNLAILSKTIKIYDEVIWDVSGEDNDHKFLNDAGTANDGHGEAGRDGFPGESGGNVLILAQNIENPQNLTVISNGGNGSSGQNGGEGNDGNNGVEISSEEFKRELPNCVKHTFSLSTTTSENLPKVLHYIKDHASIINIAWFEGKDTTIDHIIERSDKKTYDANPARNPLIKFVLAVMQEAEKRIPEILEDRFTSRIFINAVTGEGNEITFSYQPPVLGESHRQAFLLYKGSPAQPAGHGGEFGLGGEGGFAGEVKVESIKESGQIFPINIISAQGQDGKEGLGGKYGTRGRSGWDIGWMDFDEWKVARFRDHGKYELLYHEDKREDSVWCPYKREFTSMVSTNHDGMQQTYEERKNSRQNMDRQYHAEATTKKNISRSSILANYSHHFAALEKRALKGLQYEFENMKQHAIQASTAN